MNAFNWRDGTPSIFATPAAIKEARRVEAAKESVAAKPAPVYTAPVIKTRKPSNLRNDTLGRPPIYIDEAELRALRVKGWGLRKCAEAFGCDPKTIAARLLLMAGKA